MAGAPVILPIEIGTATHNLVFKFGTLRLAEQELGRPITEDLAAGKVGLDVLSALFWAALQPSLRITREGSDDFIDEAGIDAIGSVIGEGISRYFGGKDQPADEASAEGNAPTTKAKKPKG